MSNGSPKQPTYEESARIEHSIRSRWIPHLAYSGRKHCDGVETSPPIEAQNITYTYPGQTSPTLSEVSFTLPLGQCAALIGANGSGKSTLVKILAGQIRHKQGNISIRGLHIGQCHHRVAYLPQKHHSAWEFPITVYEVVLAGRYVHLGWLARPTLQDKHITQEAIHAVGLAGKENALVRNLSGGQIQRVLFARALAQKAEIFLLDEPFSAMDSASKQSLEKLIQTLKENGASFLVSTHEESLGPDIYDFTLYLNHGRLQ